MASKTHIEKGFQKPQRTGSLPGLNKRLYDLKEASIYLGRPVYSIRVLIWNGALPVVKEGRKMYVDLLDLDGYIEQNKVTMI